MPPEMEAEKSRKGSEVYEMLCEFKGKEDDSGAGNEIDAFGINAGGGINVAERGGE